MLGKLIKYWRKTYIKTSRKKSTAYFWEFLVKLVKMVQLKLKLLKTKAKPHRVGDERFL